MGVDEGVFDVSVSEELHDVEDVFGFVIFHCGFPVSECVEGYLRYSWVFEFGCDSFALSLIAFSHGVLVDAEDFVGGFG